MSMTSAQRLQTAMSHQEPDRVPYALSASMHPARDMGVSIEEYFSRPELVVKGQLSLREKLGNDMLSAYPFAALEMLAWGGEVIYFEQGPPNSGQPVITKPEDIASLEPPRVEDSPDLRGVLEATSQLKAAVGDEVPIAGVIVSPFTLPIMQMGFEAYLELIYQRPQLLERLLAVNTEYCVAWANAQLRAGAGAIVCYDPAASPTILPAEIVLRHALPRDQEVISRVQGGVVIHLASGRGLPLVEAIVEAGAVGMSASAEEDLGRLKAACGGRLCVVGNLNALEMMHWTAQQAEAKVKEVLAAAGEGGGLVISDNHGEIPLLVDWEVLYALSEALRRWGRYPLDWMKAHEA